MGKGGCRAGAGRPGRYRKTSDMRQIDVRRLAREKRLYKGASFGWEWRDADTGEKQASIWMKVIDGCLECSYTLNSQHDVKDRAPLITTECNYGGKRYWFTCPCCGGRCAVLYLSKRVACRKCHQLVYESQSENLCNRTARSANKIRDRLGWEPGILNIDGWKPKGMHWRTFDRLTEKHNHYLRIAFADMKKRYGFCF